MAGNENGLVKLGTTSALMGDGETGRNSPKSVVPNESGRPKLLDLFCGAGGASMGYHRAGFEVEGVDIKPQPHYPFKFYQADALEFPLGGYDAYHASPECKKWSVASRIHGGEYPDQVTPIRQRLIEIGKPYVIENVGAAPLKNPYMLCGTMFGLKVRRHRYFECSFDIYFFPACCACKGKDGYTNSRSGFSAFKNGAKLITVGGHNFAVDDARLAMGIYWTNQLGLSQAIPPAYTEYIGKYLMKVLNESR